MTIKSKLIANIAVTLAIIAFISMASYSSLRFVQDKISYMAEKSTPFQMGTVELQRELQSCITNLIKVHTARTLPEFNKFRGEAELSIKKAAASQKQLATLSSATPDETVEMISRISGELFQATEARINAGNAANEAQARASKQIRESSASLKGLEKAVQQLQIAHASAFATALEHTGQLSARLQALESLRNQTKDLATAANSVHDSGTTKAFLIARGKVKTLINRIASNRISDLSSNDLTTLNVDMNEFLQLHATAIAKKDADSIRWDNESFMEIVESINRINLMLSQEIELTSSKLAIENKRQGVIYGSSTVATTILLDNSELVAMAYEVSGKINRFFTLDSTEDLDRYASESRNIFAKIHERSLAVQKALGKLDAKNELKLIHAAHQELKSIRSEIFSAKGILATLHKKLGANKKAAEAEEKLHALVAGQSARGNESVLSARQEQKKSIAIVHKMVSQSIAKIGIIDVAAIIVGLFFGGWIYRTVMNPLQTVIDAVTRQKKRVTVTADLAKAVAAGDLSREVQSAEALQVDRSHMNNDEMSRVLNAIEEMSQAQVTLDKAFAGMTASLRDSRNLETRRDHLKTGLNDLNGILREEPDTVLLAEKALAFIAEFVEAGVGVMYRYDYEEECLHSVAGYATPADGKRLKLGEGLPGQAALERKKLVLNAVPPGYLPIVSALGKAEPLNIVIIPIIHNEVLCGVVELGSFRLFNEDDFEFLKPALEGIAIALKVGSTKTSGTP